MDDEDRPLKTKILVLKTIDWSILLIVAGMGIYGVMNFENKKMFALAAVLGLFLVNRLGVYTVGKIAAMKTDLEIQQRKRKKEQSYREF